MANASVQLYSDDLQVNAAREGSESVNKTLLQFDLNKASLNLYYDLQLYFINPSKYSEKIKTTSQQYIKAFDQLFVGGN